MVQNISSSPFSYFRFYFNKQGVISFFSIFICLGIIAISIHLESTTENMIENHAQNSSPQKGKSEFKQVNFFQLNLGEKYHHIMASSFFDDPSRSYYFFRFPKGTIFMPEREPIDYQSHKGRFVELTQTLYLEQDVWIHDRKTQMWGDKGLYKVALSYAHLKGNVRSETILEKSQDVLKISANELLSWPKKNYAYYDQNAHGVLERSKQYLPSIYFQSHIISCDLNKNLIQLFEEVQLKQENMKANSRKGEIFLENLTRKVRTYSLYGDVRLVEKIDSQRRDSKGVPLFIERRSFSERLDGYMNENKVVLTGMPKVVQEHDVIKGNKISLFFNNEVMEVEDSHSNFVVKEADTSKDSSKDSTTETKSQRKNSSKKSSKKSYIGESDEEEDWKK